MVYANTQTHTPRGPDTQTPYTHQNPIGWITHSRSWNHR